jgi:hypothetical protein
MRKLILISAFALASVSAQAGEGRSLILAANDAPAATTEKVETAKPAEAQPAATTDADVKPFVKGDDAKSDSAKSDSAKSDTATSDTAKSDTAKSDTPRRHASKPVGRTHVRGYEGDEAKARRIAAKYGVYW